MLTCWENWKECSTDSQQHPHLFLLFFSIYMLMHILLLCVRLHRTLHLYHQTSMTFSSVDNLTSISLQKPYTHVQVHFLLTLKTRNILSVKGERERVNEIEIGTSGVRNGKSPFYLWNCSCFVIFIIIIQIRACIVWCSALFLFARAAPRSHHTSQRVSFAFILFKRNTFSFRKRRVLVHHSLLLLLHFFLYANNYSFHSAYK